MEVYEISIFSPKNYLNDTAQFSEDMRQIYMSQLPLVELSTQASEPPAF